MTVGISKVRTSQPERLADVAAHAGTSASTVQQQLTTGRQAVAQMRNGWEGTASDAANARAEQTFAGQQKIIDALTKMQSVLSSGGSQLSRTRSAIVGSVTRLEQVGFQVADDGTVSISPGSRLAQLAKSSQVTAVQLQSIAASSSAQLKGRLVNFGLQDQSIARALNAATADLNAVGADAGSAPVSFSQGPEDGYWDMDGPFGPEWVPGIDPDYEGDDEW